MRYLNFSGVMFDTGAVGFNHEGTLYAGLYYYYLFFLHKHQR